MKEQHLNDFFKQIEPFRHLWRSARFVGYAAYVNDTWVFLGGRILLSEAGVCERTLTRLADSPDFFAFLVELPIDSLSLNLQQIVKDENIELSLGKIKFRDIRLRSDPQNTLYWYPPSRFERPMGSSKFKLDQTGFQWTIQNDWHIARFVPSHWLERVDEQLRLDRHINGIVDLAERNTPGLGLASGDHPVLEIIAPLPFRFRYIPDKGVRLTIPETARVELLRLKAFFSPGTHYAERVGSLEDFPTKDEKLEIVWKFEWPADAERAEVRLFYADREIDAVLVQKWVSSATIWGAVNEYFDPNHERLRKSLGWELKAKSIDFELGVTRLLNILGIPAVFYGTNVEPDRPDGAAVITAEDGSASILLIECTREKPADKFSAMAARSRQLQESLQSRVEVLPIVFTASGVVDTDVAMAAEHGVCLIGADEIAQLLEAVAKSGKTSDRMLDYFRQRASAITDLERFRSRW